MKRWKKWVLRSGLGLATLSAVATLILGGVRYVALRVGQDTLAEVTGRLDADDPGWRLEDILAAREAKFPPDDENAILLIQRLHSRRPEHLREWQSNEPKWLPETDRNHLPHPDDVAAARQARDGARGLVEEARRLRHLARGGAKLDVKPDPLQTLLEHTQNVRWAAWLLRLDAVLHAYHGKPDRAV